jgi:crotonobetainyl-CoA:carnitine CoA-transferase CaiB-like acyl-CoA transferase
MTEASGEETGYPLAGLKVLDFSRVLAGPFAGRMLSDLGADVVKVEPPDGDVTRLWGAVIADIPGYYSQQNAGKRNICVDLRAEGARELVFDLVRQADVLIENYRPDVMPRLGLGYDDLKRVNPRLIMLSISGFGHNGPESHRPAYAPIVHAEIGLMARQARRGDIPYRDMPLSVADTNASLHGLVALLAAVIHRGSTGVGQHIDIAMVDTTLVTDDQVHYDLEGSEDTAPLPNDTWETAVGPILVSSDFRYLWQLVTKEHGFIEDPTSKDMDLDTKIAMRRAAMAQFMAGLDSWEAVERTMAAMNIAWGRVRDPVDVREQATVKARGTITHIDDRAGSTRPIPQSPYRFSAAQAGVRGPARHRGEDNAPVLSEWLGKTSLEVDALLAAGVLSRDEETLGE